MGSHPVMGRITQRAPLFISWDSQGDHHLTGWMLSPSTGLTDILLPWFWAWLQFMYNRIGVLSFKKKESNYTSLWSPKLQQFFQIHVSYVSNCLSQKQVWLNRKLLVWYLNTDSHANTQSCSQDVINICISKNYSWKKMTQNSWYICNGNHCINIVKWTWIYIWQGSVNSNLHLL